jgi:hypothetical protein
MGRAFYNKCDICGIEEKWKKNIAFTIWTDICDFCLHCQNGGPNSYEWVDGKWSVKKSKTTIGVSNE